MACSSCGKAKAQRGYTAQASVPKTAAQILAAQIQQQQRQQQSQPVNKQRVFR